MKLNLKPVALTTALCLSAPQVFAGTQLLDDHVTFSGFGTLGLTQTDSDKAEFRRDRQSSGATTKYSFDVDSNVGLQLTGKANDWLSATVQVLGIQRLEDHIETEVEWAFLKVTPIDGLAIRGGRMALPMFMISDSRNIGYANTWIRPPNEAYGLALFSRLEGGDISYRIPLGSTSLSATVLVGETSLSPAGGIELKAKKLRAANLVWETSWGSLRAGRMSTQFDLTGFLSGIETYTFTGFGATFDRNNVVGQAEYVRRDSKLLPDGVNADAWYVLGGYRFGTLLPYLSYASTKPEGTTGMLLSGKQSTGTVGLRWDAFRSAAIKFQVDRVDVKSGDGISFTGDQIGGPGAPPVGIGTVTVGAIAVDFVF